MKLTDVENAFMAEFNAMIERRGISDEQITQHFGISQDTLDRWKTGISTPHPSFREFVLRDLEELSITEA